MLQETQQSHLGEQHREFKPSSEPSAPGPNSLEDDNENDPFMIDSRLDEDVILEGGERVDAPENGNDVPSIMPDYDRFVQEKDELLDRFGEDLELYYQYYILGVGPDEPDSGDYMVFHEMVMGMPDVRAMLDERRAAEIGDGEVITGIEQSAPELLRGTLPSDQEQLLANKEYILGVNQSGAATVAEALEYVDASRGIDLGMYSLYQRFKLLDKNTAQHSPDDVAATLAHGYYGNSDILRYVIAMPMDEYYKAGKRRTADSDASHALDDDKVPQDFLTFDASRVSGMEHGYSVSPKYIAGFIDGEGNYHANKNFTKSDQFELATSDIPHAVE